MLAGCRDRALPSARAMRSVALHTAALFAAALALEHASPLAERTWWTYRYLVFPTNRGLHKAPLREFFRVHLWFLVALPCWRAVHAALRTLGLRRALPPLALALHFGCWGANCRWPFLRHPHELDVSTASLGYYGGSRSLRDLAASLPQNDLSVIAPYFLYYAFVPALLPAGFPASLPPTTAPRCLVPRCLRRADGRRRLWVGVLLLLLALCTAAQAAPTRIADEVSGGDGHDATSSTPPPTDVYVSAAATADAYASTAPTASMALSLRTLLETALYHSKRAYGRATHLPSHSQLFPLTQ